MVRTVGSLPFNLAAVVCARGASYRHLSLKLNAGNRGRELSSDDESDSSVMSPKSGSKESVSWSPSASANSLPTSRPATSRRTASNTSMSDPFSTFCKLFTIAAMMFI
ncbi:MAG: hypothetical protein LBR05_10075, partial [Azoarcus sp.]|nr:hypothetical protein [Azoarcus sp.]